MKKAVFLLIILSLMRVGVVYADAADNTAKNQDYFFGVKNASSNLISFAIPQEINKS